MLQKDLTRSTCSSSLIIGGRKVWIRDTLRIYAIFILFLDNSRLTHKIMWATKINLTFIGFDNDVRSSKKANWVFHDRPVWRISVRLSDRSKVTQHKINFIKNCPQWGLNSQPPDYQSRALPTVLGRNLLEICEVSFPLFHAPLHMLDFVYFWNQ